MCRGGKEPIITRKSVKRQAQDKNTGSDSSITVTPLKNDGGGAASVAAAAVMAAAFAAAAAVSPAAAASAVVAVVSLASAVVDGLEDIEAAAAGPGSAVFRLNPSGRGDLTQRELVKRIGL